MAKLKVTLLSASLLVGLALINNHVINANKANNEYVFTQENTYIPYSDYSQPEYDQSRDRKENMEVNPNAKSSNKDCDTENRRSEKYNSKTGRLEYRACYTTSAKKVKSAVSKASMVEAVLDILDINDLKNACFG